MSIWFLQLFTIFGMQFQKLSQPDSLKYSLPNTFMNTFSTLVIIISVPLLARYGGRRYSIDDVTDEEIDKTIADLSF